MVVALCIIGYLLVGMICSMIDRLLLDDLIDEPEVTVLFWPIIIIVMLICALFALNQCVLDGAERRWRKRQE
jgi:hypothetical protein